MTDKEVRAYTKKYREAITKGLGFSTWKEALRYLHSIGVDTSNLKIWRTEK